LKNKTQGKIPFKKNASKGPSGPDLKRILIPGSSALGVVLLILLILFLTRPKILWYVDEGLSANWNRILHAAPPPNLRYEVISGSGNEYFPKGRFGFIISQKGPEGEKTAGVPVALYQDLSRTREYQNWMMLALDPWMVFRKHQDPEPSRFFIDISNDRGSILLAGSDSKAVQAWQNQLLQDRPGVFIEGYDQWQQRRDWMMRDYPFQSGALSYSWIQVWPLLFRDNTAYLYAPLSQARALNPQQGGRLGVSRFPEPSGWDRYGMQADILWAQIQGSKRQQKKLAAIVNWLSDAKTQTVIADTIGWIPAHPSGTPYNTISWETQMAWLRSSYIWQDAETE